jgi:cysteine-rich repeat protein
VCASTCGDTIVAGAESCDDGNLIEDDGCGAACTLEVGFGLGIDGDLVVTSSTELPLDAAQIASATSRGLTATIVLATRSGTLSVGQKVLLHQTRSTDGIAGYFEYARIAGIAGATVSFEHPLVHDYSTTGLTRAQMMRVFEYRDVTVSANLSAAAWNNLGALGGILVLDAQGTVDIASSGRLIMNSHGFHGHSWSCPLFQCSSGTTGESYFGPGGPRTTPNGIGGGAGGVGDDGAGGGGGGNGSAGQPGSDGVCAGTGVCGEACPIPGGEGGLVAPGTVETALFFGGGGGAGGTDSEGARPGSGGYGGGIILVRAQRIVVDGHIAADGSAGGNGVSNDPACGGSGCGMGGGGGGAGGTIRLVMRTSAALGTERLTADGGGRALSTCGAADGVGGGAGGVGRIGVSAASITGVTRPALTEL